MFTWYTAPVPGIPCGGCQARCSACPGLATTCVTCPVLSQRRLGVQPRPQHHPQGRIRLEVAVDLVGGGGQHQDTCGDRAGPPRPGPQQRQPGQRQQQARQSHPRPEHHSKRQQVGNGQHTLLTSHISKPMTPPDATTTSGTQTASQRTETAPPARPPRPPRSSQPRPGALRPATSQASASNAPASKTTGSGPASSGQSSGFIAHHPAPFEHPARTRTTHVLRR